MIEKLKKISIDQQTIRNIVEKEVPNINFEIKLGRVRVEQM